jgi:hypothetical protein
MVIQCTVGVTRSLLITVSIRNMARVLTHPITVLRHVTSFAEFLENKTDEGVFEPLEAEARLNNIY